MNSAETYIKISCINLQKCKFITVWLRYLWARLSEKVKKWLIQAINPMLTNGKKISTSISTWDLRSKVQVKNFTSFSMVLIVIMLVIYPRQLQISIVLNSRKRKKTVFLLLLCWVWLRVTLSQKNMTQL